MKNKYFFFGVIKFFIIFFIFFNRLVANDIIINANEIDIKDKGNSTIASGSVKITDGENITINGDEAKFNKENQTVEINGNVIYFDKNNDLRISGNKTLYDSKNKIFKISENIVLKDFKNNYEIYSGKLIYNKINQKIESFGTTKINYDNKFLIRTKDISFDKNKNIFFTREDTIINDKFGNKFELNSLEFNLVNKIFKAKNIKLSDLDNNTLKLINGFVDLNSNELVGTDFIFNFNKAIFGNSSNDPRLIGRYVISDQSKTSMKKSTFTTCGNEKDKCPAWSISANEVTHKKQQKRIEYKQAWLEIYDVPVAYFPYFFHPDPTVKRQSGFLFPQFINSSNLGFSTQIPYFKVIDNDKDLTISPRVYANNNLFLQTEYRQAFENSELVTDISYNKKNNSNSHFFTKFIKDISDTFYEMRIETVSNKDYLKKYQINSPLINNYSVLNSSFSYEKYMDEYSFSTSVNVIEDLSKDDSDKYEYILPNYEFSKDTILSNGLFNRLSFKSSGNYRKYQTNVDEADITNEILLSSSNQNISNNLDTEFKFLLRNINTYGNYSETYKENGDHKILGSALLNFEYPMHKEINQNKKFLTPMFSIRFSPYKGINIKNEETLITFENLFTLDRINNKTIEEGASTTLGLKYSNLNNTGLENFKLGIGVNLRNKIDHDLPNSSSLGDKTSNLIGYSGINFSENASLSYNFSLDQNLSEVHYSLLNAKYSGNKFSTSFDYMNKSNYIGDESYLKNSTKINFNKSNSLGFETNKNLDKDITNYYNLIYSYKNDCMEASIVYNKQFYDEDSTNSGKNIFFKISFLPFGSINTPNINE